jgi:HEAT repeat protein
MPATLQQLVEVRSRLGDEVLVYLDTLAEWAAQLPPYYPPHLRAKGSEKTPFEVIRQSVQVVTDRTAVDRWRGEARWPRRAPRPDSDRLAYAPTRSRPETDDPELFLPAAPVPWDDRAGGLFRRAVILGDPGFGKTWLLRFEAHRLARAGGRQLRDGAAGLDDLVLPIFLRLSDLSQSAAAVEEAVIDLAGRGQSEAFRGWLRQKLTTDNCVLLLDAWDEVPVEVPREGQPVGFRAGYRQLLGQRLQAFARQFPRPRLLLTARAVGYTGPPVSGAQELELLAFDPPAIEAFVSAWFGAGDPTAGQFLEQLRQSNPVRGLARIPLMLALMCRGLQAGSLRLPARRGELYESCLRGLLRDWREEKEDRVISDTEVDAVLELLGAVGCLLFADGYEQFPESVLGDKMAAWLGMPRGGFLQGTGAASLLAGLKRDGVFIKAGQHRDAPLLFLHHTFHEYLTARHLARQVKEAGWEGAAFPGRHPGRGTTIRELVDRKAWLPTWQEVIILLAGRLDEPGPLLRLLADRRKDDLFRHRLALAARCLPEIPRDVRHRLTGLVDRITTAAFRFWWRLRRDGAADALPSFPPVLALLVQVNGRVHGVPLPEVVGEKLGDWRWQVLRAAALTAGDLGGAALTPAFRDRLLDLIVNRRPPAALLKKHLKREGIYFLLSATAALVNLLVAFISGNMIPGFEPVFLVLCLGCLWWEWKRWHLERAYRGGMAQPVEVVAESLGKLGGANLSLEMFERVMKARLSPDKDLQHLAERLLWNMRGAAVTPEVLHRLAGWLAGPDDTEQLAALDAVYGLGRGAAMPAVLHDLARLLHSPNYKVRGFAALVAGSLGAKAATPVILGRQLELLRDSEVTDSAIRSFQRLGTAAATPEVLDRLHELLGDPAVSVRTAAARVVGELGRQAATPVVLDRVAGMLHDPDPVSRSAAAQTLGRLGSAAELPEVLDRLAEMLREQPDAVRWAAAEAVAELAPEARKQEVLNCLLGLLREKPDQIDRAAGCFARTSPPPEFLQLLAESLRDPQSHVRSAAARGVGALGEGAATPAILAGLVRMLHHNDSSERSAAASALISVGKAALEPDVLAVLVKLLRRRDNSQWAAASIAFPLMAAGKRFFNRRWRGWQVRDLDELANL